MNVPDLPGRWEAVVGLPITGAAATDIIVAVAHGRGSRPRWYQWSLRCKSAELGYSPGDEVQPITGNNATQLAQTWASEAQLGLSMNSGTYPLYVSAKGTGTMAAIALPFGKRWELVVRAEW